ncbi:phage regulatory protein Rha [Fusobacterium necrophorum subsp. funduliforme ATCC 51357]|uniref:Rha family transcriptional regulator n=1 Tax=Fusobacterium necrophorum TaxID=859 RepID=UPI00025E65B0|nr:Rha family transcriptional regulator [Fusobacterium necrophorum]EIJ69924.1 phage regulatory protein Rha [Fusobacterium necrophorum subsp. funduliforme ATCC 51357]KAB0553192.1 Rha family transcriptional regulator [Fusobacterium necrophorum subsp. funduliforme]KYM44637.1 transcriptional regulator [Fusobacterium necrophorum subsp. funduliforme]KYM65486.1 transcriptional regulator [Fusobacterium necrophorum subsp. funduliforme]
MNSITNVNTMTSIEVAELTGKEHKNILADIRDESKKLEIQGIRAELIFQPGEYLDKNNQARPMYNLTKEGVLQLAARYDAVVRFKLIERVTKPQKPLSIPQQLLQNAQYLVEMENRVSTVEKGIARLEHNQRRTVTSNHLTVIAYANMKGIKPNQYHAPSVGKKATKLCREQGLAIGSVVDSRYGLINTYPVEILDQVFFG